MKQKFLYIGVFFIIGIIIFRSQAVITFSKDAMNMCYSFIIPSLFPFFVCSGILIYSGFGASLANAAQGIMRPLFNVAPAGAAAFVLGALSGFPSGAVCTAELYRCGNLSKSEAERLLAFCNNSGPLFIIGVIGTGMYHSVKYGIILYIIHICSSLLVGIAMRNYKKDSHSSPPTRVNTNTLSADSAFTAAINSAAQSILTVCFSIIFFSAISRAVLEIISPPPIIDAFISGLCEFSTGALKIHGLDIESAKRLVLTSSVIGFSGISVHLQVAAVVSKSTLSLKPYIFGKCLHSITAAVITAAVFLIISPKNIFISDIRNKLSASFSFSALMLFASVVAIISISAVSVALRKRSKSF